MNGLNADGGGFDILKKFMIDMNAWEVDFFKAWKEKLASGSNGEGFKVSYRERLEIILEEYALKDKSNFGRLIDMGCKNPPTYDPKTDLLEVLSLAESETVVKIEQTVGAETVSRVVLVRKNGAWKIKKKENLGYDEKWRRSPL